MNPKITEIELLLDKMNLLFNEIKADGHIDKIEAELFLKYVRQLNDKVESIAGVKQENRQVEVKENPVQKIETKEILQKELPEIKTVEKKVEEVKSQMPEVNIKAFEDVKSKTEIKQEVPVKEKAPVKKPVINIPDDEEETGIQTGLNNKLSKEKKTLADKITNKKVSDLRTAIDLNERIYFIRELFNGDNRAYDQVINFINGLTTKDQLADYVNNDLKIKFRNAEPSAVERFTELVKNKFE